jgi:fructoselysine-6-P-deglycase FrlB-like protein
MQTQPIITSLMSSHFQDKPLRQVFLVACGGSLVDMYPAHYFLNEQSENLRSWMMTANEFVHAAPRALGASSLVIVCSHGGNTPESVAAAQLAKTVVPPLSRLRTMRKRNCCNGPTITCYINGVMIRWSPKTRWR